MYQTDLCVNISYHAHINCDKTKWEFELMWEVPCAEVLTTLPMPRWIQLELFRLAFQLTTQGHWQSGIIPSIHSVVIDPPPNPRMKLSESGDEIWSKFAEET